MLGRGKRRLEAALRRVLQFVPNVQDAYASNLTAHCIRVGTTLALTKLRLTEPQLKSWIGWAPALAVWAEYMRNPYYTAAEVAFLRLLFFLVGAAVYGSRLFAGWLICLSYLMGSFARRASLHCSVLFARKRLSAHAR